MPCAIIQSIFFGGAGITEKIFYPDSPDEGCVFPDIAYGEHERQRLDLSIPSKRISDSGVILFIHGGGWVSCDKSVHWDDVKYWTSKGFVTADMNYRYASSACHVPDMLEDISAALELIKSKSEENGLKISKALLTGGSAGAHLALMYAYTMTDKAPILPVAAAVCCPPVDLTPADIFIRKKPELEDWRNGVLSFCSGREITGGNINDPDIKEILRSISPIYHIKPGTVPTLIAHGNEDEIVPFSQCIDLHNKLRENGVPTDLIVYDRTGHDMKGDEEAEQRYKELFYQYALRYLD
ncbi:MAG: alpha/beta hydrolase [Clostridiales bacterium]|nr:alpha/beta hydrolase [Clostridiales bacterium]